MKVIVAIGTRPEAIKMAPVIQQLRLREDVRSLVCVTGQHRQMLDQALRIFDVIPDIDFDVMREGQTLNQVTSQILVAFDAMLAREKPDLVLVHGDTTTAMAVSLASFHRGIAVGHVEAGLRTYNMTRPFPEEMNRRMIDMRARFLFAPTGASRQNLLAEGVDDDRVYVTGNTVVDALTSMLAKIKTGNTSAAQLEAKFPCLRHGKPLVLITGHRRESFGPGIRNMCLSIAELSRRHDCDFVYPVHMNPNVAGPVHRLLGGLPNVILSPPLDYVDFITLLGRAHIVITDSGGVQEEAVSLGKPVLVTRKVTERPEGIDAGLARLVGTDIDRIVSAFDELAGGDQNCSKDGCLAYGDGRAAERIVRIIAGHAGKARNLSHELAHEN